MKSCLMIRKSSIAGPCSRTERRAFIKGNLLDVCGVTYVPYECLRALRARETLVTLHAPTKQPNVGQINYLVDVTLGETKRTLNLPLLNMKKVLCMKS